MSLADLPLAELLLIRLEVITGGMHDWAVKGFYFSATLTEPNNGGFPCLVFWGLISHSLTSSWSLHIPATHSSHRHACIPYMFVFACMYIRIWMCTAYMQKRRSLSLVEHLIMLLIKGEHISSFFHFLNWAISSTVLLVITNLVGRYGGEEGMKSWKLVNKNRGKTGERLVKIREGRIVRAKERAVMEWYNEAKMQSVTNVWGREKR